MNKKIFLLIAIVIIALFFIKILPMLGSDTEKIRKIIHSAKAATEKEDLLKCISFVSLDYNDKHGNNRGSLFLIAKNVFRAYGDILIVIEDLKIDVESNLKAKAHVIASGQGRRAEGEKLKFILDTERVEFDVNFKKEGNNWKVVELNFIQPDDFLQLLKGL